MGVVLPSRATFVALVIRPPNNGDDYRYFTRVILNGSFVFFRLGVAKYRDIGSVCGSILKF